MSIPALSYIQLKKDNIGKNSGKNVLVVLLLFKESHKYGF